MRPDALTIGEAVTRAPDEGTRWPIPQTWDWVPLCHFLAEGLTSIDPRRAPKETFLLYSVPAFENGRPEIVFRKGCGFYKAKDCLRICPTLPHGSSYQQSLGSYLNTRILNGL